MASPLPNTKAPAAVKKVKSAHSVPPVTPATANKAARGTGEKLATPVFPFRQAFQNALGGSLDQPDEETRDEKEQHLFGLGKNGHSGGDQVDRPEQRVATDGFGGQLVGTVGNDPNHAGTHPIEHGLHPGESSIERVEPAEDDHHQKRWPDKGQSHQGCSQDAIPNVAQVHRELGGQRTRAELGEGQSLLVVSLGDPGSLLDEVTLHIPDERHWTTKAERPQS